jgi:hypothetical protein
MPKREGIYVDLIHPIKKEDLLQRIKEELDREHPQDLIDSDKSIHVTINRQSKAASDT